MSNFAIHPAEPFKQLAISGYLMDTHMSFHIKLNIFVLNFFFPEECSMQKKGAIDNNERNDKACDAEAKIDYGNLVIYFNVCWSNINIHVLGGGGGDQNIRLTFCYPSVLSV